MSVAAEFPDYPVSTLPELGAAWQDDSWHNDACPKFRNAALGLILFIDYPDKAMRDYGTPRYVLVPFETIDGSDELGTDLLATESWNEMAAALAEYAR